MALVFTNTRTRSKQPFIPIAGNQVGMYTCGPTVYNVAHIGNFMAYIDADAIQRYLRIWKHYDVRWVMNITDVDDKTIRDSAIKYPDMDPIERLSRFTREYEAKFLEDLAVLGIDRADVHAFPRATDHIPAMISMIMAIDAAGYAYELDGSVYFNVRAYHDAGHYGELLHIDFDGFQAGVRIQADEYAKDNVQDFVLWKAAKEGEPAWDGLVFHGTSLPGRPGWHIECSAMSLAYLGTTFDIHTGGVDLIFPHHENEIAQSTAANGARHAEFWLHNEHLLVDDSKMSKSKGNFYTLRDLLERDCNPVAFRMLVLSAHYRSKLNFTFAALTAAGERIERLNELIRKLQRITSDGAVSVQAEIDTARAAFEQAMDDDINAPAAWAVVFDFVRMINARLDSLTGADATAVLDMLRAIDDVFRVMTFTGADTALSSEIAQLVADRDSARRAKDFAKSDELRDALRAHGIEVKDTTDGQVIRRI